MADYLKKPFSIDEVMSVVEREIVKSKGRPGWRRSLLTLTEKPPRLYIFGQRDLEQIEAVLSRLRAQATAESAMLVEQAGYVIAAKGHEQQRAMSSRCRISLPVPDRLRRPWRRCWAKRRTSRPVTWKASASASIPLRWAAACIWQ